MGKPHVRFDEGTAPEGASYSTGKKSIEWLLLTTLPVATAEDAERMVTWYSYRWRIGVSS